MITLEGLEVHDILNGCGIPDPLQHLPRRHNPHIIHGLDGVQEQFKSLLVMGRSEPKINNKFVEFGTGKITMGRKRPACTFAKSVGVFLPVLFCKNLLQTY